jgi:50S ribosome-binding GTPase
VTDDLSATLRRTRDALEPVRARFPAAAQAFDVLERDLLPRTAGGDAYLIVGIVGPNNAGKSALFNSLAGRQISPSVPTGGATRRLVGAAHPQLLAVLRSEPTLARFRLRPFGADTIADAPLQPATDPTELLVAEEPRLPPMLMLIDTPDFDSILEDNRVASESLLAVADLVIAIVTRHSYQNKAVVRFLERWLQHGRPWMLIYNEAIDATVASAHAIKLAADVGTPPLAVFWAPHSLAVQEQRAPLEPVQLCVDGAAAALRTEPPSGPRLQVMLFDLEQVAQVKARAFDAALGRLRGALRDSAAALAGEALRASAIVAAAETRAFETGMRVASAAMPARPFVDAFRTVLDRRSNPFSRSWRTTLRHIRLGIESIPARLRGRRAQTEGAAAISLAQIERDELAKGWPQFWEELVRDLGREARHPARQSAAPVVVEQLDRDLDDRRGADAQARAEGRLRMAPADVGEFQRACEELVEKAIEQRGFDDDIQAAADLATLVPIALAAAVIINTGGLGADLAAAGGGALGTFLFEKYAHVLGHGVMADARRRWIEVRGRQLAQALTDAALPGTAPALRTAAARDTDLARELQALERELGADP